MPKLSVIVPIYRTERFIEKCLRSIMAQTFKDIEILCVDDLSPDRSVEIVVRLAEQDDRIRLIRHNRNRGLGGARNTGIAAACAPYVAGVDSDDHILPEMMERLWAATDDENVDVVACGINFVDEAGYSTGQKLSPPPGRYANDKDQIDIFEVLNPAFCNKIWRTELFTENSILFHENCYFEDLATTPRVLRYARGIRVIRGDYYQYVRHATSITHGTGPKHIVDYFKTYDILNNFLETEGLKARYSQDLTNKIGRSLSHHANCVIDSSMRQEEKTQYLKFMLMLKLGYLEYNSLLRTLDARALQRLLLNATDEKSLCDR